MATYKKSGKLSAEILTKIRSTNLREDMMTRAAYSSDASIFRRVPAAVLEPRTVGDIRAGLEIAHARSWKVVGRGGGSSVAGNAIGDGLIIDTSRYFNRILDIDPVNKTATVEPGVICDDLRQAALEHGLTYGPDPSTHSRCTIGGMVANNACGSHSVAYGTAAENLIELTLMNASGEEIVFSKGQVSDADIEAKLEKFVSENEEIISTELGRFPRQVSGYGLHYMLAAHGFDYAKAVAGSEGTTGIITKLKVNLVEEPKHKALAVLAFKTVFDAARAAPLLRLQGVTTIEGMGGDLLAALRSKKGQATAGKNLPGSRKGLKSGGWLYCETVGDSLEEAVKRAEKVKNTVNPIDALVVSDTAEMKELWRIRESSAGLVTRLPDGREAWPSWEDSAVPAENLADYLSDLYDLMEKYRLEGIPFGHFGEGCVHLRINFDLGTSQGIEQFEQFMEEAALLVTGYGGSLSGEHGDGRARSKLLSKMYSDKMLRAFECFKFILDPNNLFNPGVLVLPQDLSDGIRMAPGQRAFELKPVQKFSDDKQSMVNAVNRCVGVAACRSNSGSMCPSFQITGDEVDSTRGRARVLSEMFRGESINKGYKSPEVANALDLCLSCKACASECPVNVDMAKYKSEFLHGHYNKRIRPMAHYTMGWLPLTAHIVHKIPKLPTLVDKLMSNKWTQKVIAKIGGLDSGRPLIQFSDRSLRKWYTTRNDAKKSITNQKTVVLWPDSFNSSLDIGPAKAAVEILELLGYKVEIPKEFVCCGLTWHSTGQLDTAKKVLEKTAEVMKPYLDRKLPVVGIEPSCTVMLQSEICELSESYDVERLSESTVSFAEFIFPEIGTLLNEGHIKPKDIQTLTQVHCHEESLGNPSASKKLLELLGISNEQIETGCCGLAGNWGFEPGHAKMSFELGERELFPKARRANQSGKRVIADGFSCRTHLHQGVGIKPQHIAEFLRDIIFDK